MNLLRKFQFAKSLATVFPRRSARGQQSGFSLIEILVAVAVLSLLVIMLGQMLGSMSRAWVNGQRRVNNFSKARALLDLMVRDLQGCVFRPDLAAFSGSSVAFYTKNPGAGSVFDSLRNLSLVNYSIDTSSSNSTLQRGDMAITWDQSAASMSFGNTSSLPLSKVVARDTSPGVVGLKVLFILQDGTFSSTYSYNPSNPVRAIGVALAVIDDQTIQQLSGAQIANLRTMLDSSISGTRSVRADWEDYLKSVDWSSYPKNLATGLKIFERYVYLPGI